MPGRGYNPSVCCPKCHSVNWSGILSLSLLFSHKAKTKSGFAPSPPAAHASASLSRVRGRQRLAYLLALSTYRCADLTLTPSTLTANH